MRTTPEHGEDDFGRNRRHVVRVGCEREIPLFARPGSPRRVATVARGEVMHAQALQLRGHPWEVRVLYDHGPLRAGMRLWTLARDMAEGYYEYWFSSQTRGAKRRTSGSKIISCSYRILCACCLRVSAHSVK